MTSVTTIFCSDWIGLSTFWYDSRYTSDGQNTERNVFERVNYYNITLLREVKDILSRENSVSTAYRVDRIFTGVHRGCMEGLGLTSRVNF
jgi:hypothetical protein